MARAKQAKPVRKLLIQNGTRLEFWRRGKRRGDLSGWVLLESNATDYEQVSEIQIDRVLAGLRKRKGCEAARLVQRGGKSEPEVRGREEYPSPLVVKLEFTGQAARAIQKLYEGGLHGPTVERVVEGLVLAELRSEGFREDVMRRCLDGKKDR